MAITTFKGVVRATEGFIGGVAGNVPMTGTAGKTLTSRDNGKTLVISNATPGNVILPPANSGNLGFTINFTFAINAAFKIASATGLTAVGDLFIGAVYSGVAAGSPLIFKPNGTTNDVIDLGGTKGGDVGSTLKLVCTDIGKWTVSGDLLALAGPTVTPFANA